MNYIKSIAVGSALCCLAGCATAEKVAVLEPVGPSPGQRAEPQSQGALQVFSARKRTPTDPNLEEFFANNDYGKNEFLLYPAHTDYTITAMDGTVVRRVHNAAGCYDDHPAVVSLAPGFYKVRAQAEEYGRERERVELPVEIKAGQTTAVHLARDWNVRTRSKNADLVRMPNGDVVGWRVPQTEYLHAGNN
jgi:hypothetical protein